MGAAATPPLWAAQVLLAPCTSAAAAPTQAMRAVRAQRAFTALGFKVGPVVGGSFAIEGSDDDFHAAFGIRLRARADGGVDVQGAPAGTPHGELPCQALPLSLQPEVAHVLFTEPPAFGPVGGFS